MASHNKQIFILCIFIHIVSNKSVICSEKSKQNSEHIFVNDSEFYKQQIRINPDVSSSLDKPNPEYLHHPPPHTDKIIRNNRRSSSHSNNIKNDSYRGGSSGRISLVGNMLLFLISMVIAGTLFVMIVCFIHKWRENMDSV